MNKEKESLVNKLIYIFMKYLYVFIFFNKYMQMGFIVFLILLIIKENKFKFNIAKEATPIFLVGIVNIISIIFNLGGYHEKERIMAAFNTAFLWCACGIVYSYVRTHNFNKDKIQKYMFLNIGILTTLSVIMIVLTKMGYSRVTILSRNLMRTDWLYGDKSLRFRGFLLYDNLVSQMYFLAFPFAYSYIETKGKPFLTFLFLIISTLPVIMCKSRMGIMLCVITICLLLPNTITKTKKSKQALYLLYTLAILVIIGVKYGSIYNKIYDLINGRMGSTNTRMNIYRTSINMALTKSPLIGCGIKDMIGSYPLGSHSTYVGLFYKTGIIGLLLGITGIIKVLIPIKKLPLQYKIAGLCLCLMLITGDLDGENWLILLFSILYGSLPALTKEKEINKE